MVSTNIRNGFHHEVVSEINKKPQDYKSSGAGIDDSFLTTFLNTIIEVY